MNDITLKVGQWIKCINNEGICFTKNKWYQIEQYSIPELELENNFGILCDKRNSGKYDWGQSYYNIMELMHLSNSGIIPNHFDFKSPLDYNPDEVV